MTRRRLRPDELDLWRQVARSATPLDKRPRPVAPPPRGSDPLPPDPPPGPEPVEPFTIGERARDRSGTAPAPRTTATWLAEAGVGMDAKAFAKLKRGKLKPEARLDLHGLTLDEAHPRLTGFILSAQSRGLRLVLVITGKGGREDPYSPAPARGVLRRQVPLWLRQGACAGAVMQVAQAHIRHGGDGAYYVYLRRRR